MKFVLPLPGEQWGSGHTAAGGHVWTWVKMDLSLKPSASLLSCSLSSGPSLTEGSTAFIRMEHCSQMTSHFLFIFFFS